MLKIALLGPTARAIAITATSVNPGFFIKVRKAYRRSCHISSAATVYNGRQAGDVPHFFTAETQSK
jgi:hypothetical protein